LLSGRTLWSEELAGGAIAVSGESSTVDRIRRAFENKGFAG
jgi:hypothetical protein